MRAIIYTVINKETDEKIYFNCSLSKCYEFINKQVDKDSFDIRYKYFSF